MVYMTKTILIIEDDALSMKLFNDLLQSHGFNTLHSVDGLNSVQLVREHRPDLIIMDIQLPEVSGLEHTKALKADDELKNIPVLAVTSFAMKGDRERIIEAGCNGYISKPISVPHFLDEVKRFLTMASFRLTDALIVGHAEVDSEHEQLAVLSNEFMEFLEVGDNESCDVKIQEITQAIESHFSSEEKIMKDMGYPGLVVHKANHLSVLENYGRLINVGESNGYGGSFASELTSILVHDMIRDDLDFKTYLQELDYRE